MYAVKYPYVAVHVSYKLPVCGLCACDTFCHIGVFECVHLDTHRMCVHARVKEAIVYKEGVLCGECGTTQSNEKGWTLHANRCKRRPEKRKGAWFDRGLNAWLIVVPCHSCKGGYAGPHGDSCSRCEGNCEYETIIFEPDEW